MKRPILLTILLYCIPLTAMILLIPYVENDHSLAFLYVACIIALTATKSEKYDFFALGFGIVAATFFELLFVSTGIETFKHQSLFNLIPAWLPFLWGYIFVTIKRSLNLLRD
jgi:hypothetical protein